MDDKAYQLQKEHIINQVHTRSDLQHAIPHLINAINHYSSSRNQSERSLSYSLRRDDRYIYDTIKKTQRPTVYGLLGCLSPYLKLTEHDRERLAEVIPNPHQKVINPTMQERYKWLYWYVQLMTMVKHEDLRKISVANGYHPGYIEKLYSSMHTINISHMMELLPYLSLKDVHKILTGNYKPVHKALRRFRYELNSRQGFNIYLQYIARFHGTTLTQLIKRLNSTQKQTNPNVRSVSVIKSNYSTIITLCEGIAKIFNMNPSDLIKPFKHADIQGYNQHKQKWIRQIQDRLTLRRAIRMLGRMRGLSLDDLSKKIDKSISKIVQVGFYTDLQSMTKALAPYLHFTKNDLNVLGKKLNSRKFVIIRPKNDKARRDIYRYIWALMDIHHDTLTMIGKRIHSTSDFVRKQLFKKPALNVAFIKDNMPYMSFHELNLLSKGNTSPLSDLVFKLQKEVHSRESYKGYVRIIAILKGTTLGRMSRALGHDKTYIQTSVRAMKRPKAVEIFTKVAKLLNVKPRLVLDPLKRVSLKGIEHTHSKSHIKKPQTNDEILTYHYLKLYLTVSSLVANKTLPDTAFTTLLLVPHRRNDNRLGDKLPYISAYVLNRIRQHHYHLILVALKRLGKKVHDRHSFLKYLDLLAQFRNTSPSEISLELNKPSSYVLDIVDSASTQETDKLGKAIAKILHVPSDMMVYPLRQIHGLIAGVHDRVSMEHYIVDLGKKKGYGSLKKLSKGIGRSKSYLRDSLLQGTLPNLAQALKTLSTIVPLNDDTRKKLIKSVDTYKNRKQLASQTNTYHSMMIYLRLKLISQDSSLTKIANSVGHKSGFYVTAQVRSYATKNHLGNLSKMFSEETLAELTQVKQGDHSPINKQLTFMCSRIHNRKDLTKYVHSLLIANGYSMTTASLKLHEPKQYIHYALSDISSVKYITTMTNRVSKLLHMDARIMAHAVSKALGKPKRSLGNPHMRTAVKDIAKKSWMSVETLSDTLYQDPNWIYNVIAQKSVTSDYKLLTYLMKVSQVKSTPAEQTLKELQQKM